MATEITLTTVISDVTEIDFTLHAGGTISGYVVMADSTTPIPGAQVWVEQ